MQSQIDAKDKLLKEINELIRDEEIPRHLKIKRAKELLSDAGYA